MMGERTGTDRGGSRSRSRSDGRPAVGAIFPPEGKPKAWVEYIVGEIEQVTGDTHSRRMFEIIAGSLPDDVIFQILSEIRQGEGIRNRGAVFVAAAKRRTRREKKKTA
jgi:hypothetical protein